MLGIDRRVARYTWTAVVILLLLAIIYGIRDTLFVFMVALLFAYLLWPLVEYLDHHLPGKSRAPALAIVYALVVALLIFAALEIGSRVAMEANTLITRLPELLSKAQQQPQRALSAPPIQSIEETILLELRRLLAEHSQQIFALMPKAAIKIASAARYLFFFLLVPILSFFFLKDGYKIRDFVREIFSEGLWRRQLLEIGADLHVLLAQYMRALVFLAGVAFAAYGIFLSLVRAPYAILLAAVAGPLEFIPMVGPFVAFVIILLAAAFSGFQHLLWIAIFLVIFRLCQDYVISPHLMSAEMKLSPLVVIFGVLAGAELGGVIGAFLSVPVIAVFRVIYIHLRKKKLVVERDIFIPSG